MAERLVVIGGDAGGMAAATQARRLRPTSRSSPSSRARWTSYSACGIPYLVGGDVDDARRPRRPHARRSSASSTRIDVRAAPRGRWRIDLDAREVEVRDHDHDRTYSWASTSCTIGTGARPIRPDLPGIDVDRVHGVQTLDDAADLLEHGRARAGAERVVVVGGGYIGLEMAEAFLRPGRRGHRRRGRRRRSWARSTPTWARSCAEAHARASASTSASACGSTGFEPGAVHTADGPDRRRPRRARPRRRARTPSWPPRPGIDHRRRRAPSRVDRRQRTRPTACGPRATAASRSTSCREPPRAHRPRHRRQQAGPGRRHQHRRRLRHLPRRASAPRSPRCAAPRSPAPGSPSARPTRAGLRVRRRHDRVDDAGPATSRAPSRSR